MNNNNVAVSLATKIASCMVDLMHNCFPVLIHYMYCTSSIHVVVSWSGKLGEVILHASLEQLRLSGSKFQLFLTVDHQWIYIAMDCAGLVDNACCA